jgi:hypothetical protein
MAKIRAAMPVDYNVDVNLSDGRRLLSVVKSTTHHITIPNVGSTVSGSVVVAAMRSDDTQGKTRTVKFAPRRGATSS